MSVFAGIPDGARAVYVDARVAFALLRRDGQWGVWKADGPRVVFDPAGDGTFDAATSSFTAAVRAHLDTKEGQGGATLRREQS